jgi:hypothetical protein
MTDEAGPEKPGNSVEEKILPTGKRRGKNGMETGEPAACDGKHTPSPPYPPVNALPGSPDNVVGKMERYGRKTEVTPHTSRIRASGKRT